MKKLISSFFNFNWLPKKAQLYVQDCPEILFTFRILFVAIFVLLVLDFAPIDRNGYLGNLFAEFHGLAFDLIVFGILIVVYNRIIEKRRSREQDIKRWQEEIDDFRHWPAKEAAYRIAGNIRRLNRNGIYEIDLSDCNLSDVVLDNANLSGSNLAYVDFCGAQLLAVDFSMAKMFHAEFIKADLSWAIFNKADMYRADFRGAINLEVDQFDNSFSLYGAKLDPELEAQVREKYPHLLEEPKEKQKA